MGNRNKPAYVRCPSCESNEVRRSRRRGFLEQIGLRFLWMRPFHCDDCYKRFYGHPGPIYVPPLEPSLTIPQPKWLQDHPKRESEIPVTGVPVERRAFSRLRCQIPARLTSGAGSRATGGVVSGISLSGCFIEVPIAMPVGSEIEISLEVGEGARSRGLVRRSLPAQGIGIEFILMTAPNFRRLQSIAKDSVRLGQSPA